MSVAVGTAVGYLTLDYSKFKSSLNAAVFEATALSTKFSETLGTGLQNIGNSIATVGSTLTTGITVPLGVAGASAIKFGAEFDKQMSAVKSVTNATTEEFNTMRKAAIEWGGKTVYTASEAGQALYYMGLAGWDAQKSVSGLGPVLNLAAAGNLDLGRTSDIVTDAMTAMGLEAGKLTKGIENTTHFTNVLASTMANSNTDVDQLGEAFKYVAPLAGSLGMSIDDLGLALGLMANVGVKASQAGTSLRQALKNLISPTEKAQSAMDKYGVSLFDSEGKAKSMRQFMEELRGTFGDLKLDIYDASGELKSAEQIMEEYGHSLPTTQQEKLNAVVDIFGTRALPGILGIIDQTDDQFNNLANAIDGCDTAFGGLGYAAGMAETQLDNLQGDWVRFTSALGTAKIAISDLVNNQLRCFVQKLTELVTKFNNMDQAQQAHILKLLAIAAAIGPVLLIFGKLIAALGSIIKLFNTFKTGIELVKHSVNLLWVSIQDLIPVLTGMGGAVLAAIGIVAALAAAFINLWKNSEDFRTKIIGMWNQVKAAFSQAGQAIVDLLNELGFNFETFGDVVKAVINGIKTLWNGLCQLLGPVFLAVIKTITSAIKGIAQIFTGVIQVITGLIRGFKDGDWTTLWEGLKNIFNGFVSFFVNTIESIPEAVYGMIQIVANWLGANWKITWDEAKQKVSDFITNIVNWFKQLPSNILTFLKNVVTNIVNFGIDIVNKAKEIGKNFVDGIINFFKNLPQNIGTIIGYVITKIIMFNTEMIAKAKEIGTNFVTNIINFIKELPGKFLSFLTTTIVKIQTFKNNAIQAAIATGKEFIHNIITFVTQLPGKVYTQLTNTISKVKSFANDFKNKAKEAAKGFKDALVNGAKEIPAKMAEIGKNIVQGVWRGIQGAKATFVSQVQAFFKGIVDGAKRALGIQSPSKVFAEQVGAWIPPGISEGVEDAMPGAVKDIQKSIDDGMSDIDTEDDMTISVNGFTKEFMDVVDTVTLWFESIEERLANVVNSMREDIANMINLGNLVLTTTDGLMYNYKTGLFGGDSQTNTNDDTQKVISLLDIIIDKLDKPDDDYTGGGDIIIPVNIGGEQIDTIVARANTRNDYRSGGR